MKRTARPALLAEGGQAQDKYVYVPRQMGNLTAMTTRGCLSDLTPFIAWCGSGWYFEHDEHPFTSQTGVLFLLIHFLTYFRITLWIKSSAVNRAFMILKMSYRARTARKWEEV